MNLVKCQGHFSLRCLHVCVKCAEGAYTMSGNNGEFTNLNKPGGCLHDNLQKDTVTLTSVVYNPKDDSLTINVHKILMMDISVELKKACAPLLVGT